MFWYCFHAVHVAISCNMGGRDLPDMYAQNPRAAGPRAEGIHIRQIPTAHVTSDMYHFWDSKNLLKKIKAQNHIDLLRLCKECLC